MAKKQHKSRQAVVRSMLAKKLEDRSDYQAAVKASRSAGEALPLEEVMRRYGLEY